MNISNIPFNHKIFGMLNKTNQKTLFMNNPNMYISLLPDDRLKEEFVEMVRDTFLKEEGELTDRDDVLSQQQLNELVLSMDTKKVLMLLENGSVKSKQLVHTAVMSMNETKQMNLYKENPECFRYLSLEIQDEIQINNTMGDIDQLSELPLRTQVKYFKYHMDELSLLSSENMAEILKTGEIKLSLEQFKDVMRNRSYGAGNYAEIIDQTLDMESKLNLFNIGSFYKFRTYFMAHSSEECSNLLSDIVNQKLMKIDDPEKKEQLHKLYNEMLSNISIYEIKSYDAPIHKITSMILDDNIINNNKISLLQEYSKSGEREILAKILANAYGPHVEEIFAIRPHINFYEIPTFKLFDKHIVDNLGVEFVHYCLTYGFNQHASSIASLVEPQKMESFKKIWKYTLDRADKVDASTIESIIERHDLHEKLIAQLDFEALNETQKKNLDLLLCDSPNIGIKVKNIEDLDNYLSIRTEYFKQEMEKATDGQTIQNILFEYMTGREVNPSNHTIENMGINNVVTVFNINTIIRNPEIISTIGLSNDEVALLLLTSEINNTDNMNVLKDVFIALSVSKELKPTAFSSTFRKIETYYKDALKHDLTGKDELDKMPCQIQEGLSIVNLEGEPFNLLCSVTELNLSETVYKPSKHGEQLLYDWLNREQGVTTISTALCASDISIYPSGRDIGNAQATFVFDKDVDIVGMGGSDISVSHEKREARHSFEHIGYNKMKFASMGEIKDDMIATLEEQNNGSLSKFPSEISILRKEEDIRKVNQTQERTMPIGMYVVGELTPELMETAKAFSEYYKKNGMPEFKVIKVNPEKYNSYVFEEKPITVQEKVDSNVSWYQDVQETIFKR